jgi:hypothetical protein
MSHINIFDFTMHRRSVTTIICQSFRCTESESIHPFLFDITKVPGAAEHLDIKASHISFLKVEKMLDSIKNNSRYDALACQAQIHSSLSEC